MLDTCTQANNQLEPGWGWGMGGMEGWGGYKGGRGASTYGLAGSHIWHAERCLWK